MDAAHLNAAPDGFPTGVLQRYGEPMGRQAGVVLYVLALITVVVSVDVVFFRHRFWERLMVNVGCVLVFAAFGLRFMKQR